MCLIWVTVSFNWYMVAFLLKYFPGNIYINGIFSTTSEILGFAFSGFMHNTLGVKRSFGFSFSISAIGGLAIVYYEMSTNFYSGESLTD